MNGTNTESVSVSKSLSNRSLVSLSDVEFSATRSKKECAENCSLLRCNMKEKLAKCGSAFKNRSIVVDVLSIFFGIAAWIGINSVFLQLPLLVENAPEGWSLPSYLVIMVQIGNIGPLAYTLVQKCLTHKIKDANIIYVVLSIGTVSSLLTAFLYDKTAWIAGTQYSVALFVLVFFTALNCCTSSVLFMPYMGRFREIYLITYLTGEGLSGLLPSVVALIQGVGGNTECVLVNTTEQGVPIYERYTPPPRFGSMEFFIFVFAAMACSSVAFTLLDRLSLCKKQYAAVKVMHGNSYVYEKNDDANKEGGAVESVKQLSKWQYGTLMLLIGIISMLSNGMFQSIQSYSCLPYGNQAYHLTTTLSAIANPVACFMAVFLPHTSLKSVSVLSSFGGLLTIYVFVTATMSPSPPLVGTDAGGPLVIVIWTILVGLVSYVKLSITSVMRSQGGQSLVWTGAITQIGSTVGSIIIFILINHTSIFVSYEVPC